MSQIKIIADNDYPTFTVEVAAIVTKLQLNNQDDLAKELDNALIDFWKWYEDQIKIIL
jgi:hypothetical protein